MKLKKGGKNRTTFWKTKNNSSLKWGSQTIVTLLFISFAECLRYSVLEKLKHYFSVKQRRRDFSIAGASAVNSLSSKLVFKHFFYQKCEKKLPKPKFERLVVLECVASCWHFFHLHWNYTAQIELNTENWMPMYWTYITLYVYVCVCASVYIETKNIYNNKL